MPNAPMFHDRKGRKETAWNGVEETAKSQVSHPSDYAANTYFGAETPAAKEVGVSGDPPVAPVSEEHTSNPNDYVFILSSSAFNCDDWVCDSECTTHIYAVIVPNS